jgi:hypothetical protein
MPPLAELRQPEPRASRRIEEVGDVVHERRHAGRNVAVVDEPRPIGSIVPVPSGFDASAST